VVLEKVVEDHLEGSCEERSITQGQRGEEYHTYIEYIEARLTGLVISFVGTAF